jgi:hypothetical protein
VLLAWIAAGFSAPAPEHSRILPGQTEHTVLCHLPRSQPPILDHAEIAAISPNWRKTAAGWAS